MSTGNTFLTAWQRVFRIGIVPQLTVKGLQGLKMALERDDSRLITGATTNPPPLQCMADQPVEGCCPLCYALLDGLKPYAVSVGPLEERFAGACWEADQLLGEPAAMRYFLNWVDETPREQMRRKLLAEVELALAERVKEPATPLARTLAASIRAKDRTPEQRREYGTKRDCRTWALRILGVMCQLSQRERERALAPALRINDV
jgi:hypothetical protein